MQLFRKRMHCMLISVVLLSELSVAVSGLLLAVSVPQLCLGVLLSLLDPETESAAKDFAGSHSARFDGGSGGMLHAQAVSTDQQND